MLDQLSRWIIVHPSTPFRDGPYSKANTLQCLYKYGAPGLTSALMKLHSAVHLALLDSASRNYEYGAESCRAMYSIFLEGRRHLDAAFLAQECSALWEIQERRDLWLIEVPLAALYSAAGDKMTSAFVRQERARILEHVEPQVAAPLLEILYGQGQALTRDEFLVEFDTICAYSNDALWSTEMLKALLRSKDRVMLRDEDVARLHAAIRALPRTSMTRVSRKSCSDMWPRRHPFRSYAESIRSCSHPDRSRRQGCAAANRASSVMAFWQDGWSSQVTRHAACFVTFSA